MNVGTRASSHFVHEASSFWQRFSRKIDNSPRRFEQIDTSAKRSKNFDEIPTVERRDECEQCAIEVGKLKGEGLERPD